MDHRIELTSHGRILSRLIFQMPTYYSFAHSKQEIGGSHTQHFVGYSVVITKNHVPFLLAVNSHNSGESKQFSKK